MTPYANFSGKSGVKAYENGAGMIKVQFGDDSIYLYTDASAGAGNISQMQLLATQGQGLNSFINRNVRKAYAKKLQ